MSALIAFGFGEAAPQPTVAERKIFAISLRPRESLGQAIEVPRSLERELCFSEHEEELAHFFGKLEAELGFGRWSEVFTSTPRSRRSSSNAVTSGFVSETLTAKAASLTSPAEASR